jgi:PBP1b-binding outer membrane lipoprotein LpoB
MLKKWFSLLFFVVLLIGCSSEEVSQETVANLEKDLAKSNEQLVENESVGR